MMAKKKRIAWNIVRTACSASNKMLIYIDYMDIALKSTQ